MKKPILILILANALVLITIYQIGCKKKEQPLPSETRKTIRPDVTCLITSNKPCFGTGGVQRNDSFFLVEPLKPFTMKNGDKFSYSATANDGLEFIIKVYDFSNGETLDQDTGINCTLNYTHE